MKTRVLIFIVVIGIGAIAVGWIYESRLGSDADQAELSIPDNIDYFLTNLNYRVMTVDGTLDFEFDSHRLEHYPRDDTSQIDAPSLRIYRKTDRWQVDAGRGEFRHRENLLRLQDRVIMSKKGANPIELRTERIRFEPDQDRISSEARVSIRSRQFRIDAERAIFDLASGIYRFTNTAAVYSDDKR